MGASKGIGAGIAAALGAAGARVAVNYSSDREGAERVAQAITGNGSEAIAVAADVSKAAGVARLYFMWGWKVRLPPPLRLRFLALSPALVQHPEFSPSPVLRFHATS